jgi:hypothetical protein
MSTMTIHGFKNVKKTINGSSLTTLEEAKTTSYGQPGFSRQHTIEESMKAT